jgi:DNA-directed RNA polymerase subunit RPC12/RpoP
MARCRECGTETTLYLMTLCMGIPLCVQCEAALRAEPERTLLKLVGTQAESESGEEENESAGVFKSSCRWRSACIGLLRRTTGEMAKCVRCGDETSLYLMDLPVCSECDEALNAEAERTFRTPVAIQKRQEPENS